MSQSKYTPTRRSFLRSTTLAAGGAFFTTTQAPAVLSATNANEKINVGFIGVGNRGTQLLHAFMKQPNVRIGAFCETYKPYLHRDDEAVSKVLRDDLGGRIPKMGEKYDHEVARYTDYRRLLEQNDLDAVVISTPDHWHAIQMTEACEAGKDVYVEKPLALTIKEGRIMVDTAKRTGRVVQVGLHRRSSSMYSQIGEQIQSGKIGKVTVARAYRISNMFSNGICDYQPTEPIEGLDWDMWLGPQSERPYQHNITPYRFRWWSQYSSQVANWGVHYFDTIRWALGEEAPISISAHGGQYVLKDDRTIPDTMEMIFEVPSGCLMTFGVYEANGVEALPFGEIEFRGTLGNLLAGSEGQGYKLIPTVPGQFSKEKSPLSAETARSSDGDLTEQHVRNFVDCVISRETPNCDIETGHRSTIFAHLANIALATKSRLEWDAKNERILNNEAANQMLFYEYRKPWKLG